jgi:hypothetical protein
VNASGSVSFTAQIQSGTASDIVHGAMQGDALPIQASHGVSKRKATAPPKDSESVPKKRQKRYDALEDSRNFALPNFAPVNLFHANRDQATAARKARLANLDTHFDLPSPDPSIPQSDAQRQASVRIIAAAMMDISHAEDAGTKAFNSRWAPNAPRKYEEFDIQATAWEAVVSTNPLILHPNNIQSSNY